MHPNRREILKLAGLASGGLIALSSSHLFARAVPFAGVPALGLFFEADDVARMSVHFQSNPTFAEFREVLSGVDRTAERAFMADEVRYNDQLFDIVRLSRLSENMAFLYLMTGDEDAGQLSAEAIRTIMKFDRWDYFLEEGTKVVGIQRASSTLIAVCLAADWLGNLITDDERIQWIGMARERGCESTYLACYGMRYPDRVSGWTRDESSTYFEHRPDGRSDLSRRHIIINSTNLKAVPAAALAIGAVTSLRASGLDDDVERWIEMATYSLGTFSDYFEPDGSYHEGVSYAYYTATQLALATTVLERSAQSDLSEVINWPGFVRYSENLVMPTTTDPYEIVNFGDNGNPKTGSAGKPRRSAVPFWVAARYNDGRARHFAENLAGGHDLWSLIWYDDSIALTEPPSGPSMWHSDLDWIVARTGFQINDLTVAMRSGGPGNHEHADRNSIVVKCYGEQLVTDPYRPPYRYSDPAWMMRTTAAHSAVLVDGVGHQYHDGMEGTNPSDAVATVVQSRSRARYAVWTSDATQAYALVDADVASVSRTVLVHYPTRAIILVDHLKKDATPSLFSARLFAYNLDGAGSVVAEGSEFRISRPGATLIGSTYSLQGTICTANRLPIPDDRADQHPFVEVSSASAASEVSIVTVLVPSATGTEALGATITATDTGCNVHLGMLTVEVYDQGRIPRLVVRNG